MPRKPNRMPLTGLYWTLGLLALSALACNLLGAPAPTAAPPTASPTLAAPGEPTRTPTGVSAPTSRPPSPTAEASAAPATATPPAGPDPADQEDILLLEPGPNSALFGSAHAAGQAEPTFEQNLVIQVTDAGGAVVATMPTTIQAAAGSAGPFAVDVPFSVASDQPGRVSAFSTSARDGGLIHLASAEVTLLASGSALIQPVAPHGEVHAIHVPAPRAEISGGALRVEGFSDYTFEANLALVLCGEGGSGAPDPICGTVDNVLAHGVALIAAPDIGQPGPFTADLAYAVSAPVSARLVVYSTSPRDGGLTHLASVNVILNP